MTEKNYNAPNIILDEDQYIFNDFNQGFVLSDSNFVDLYYSYPDAFKHFTMYFKKDVPYFKLNKVKCPHCGGNNVVKYGFTKRTLVFKKIGVTDVQVQRYKCNECGKTFQTDLSTLVDKNSNFTNELKEESKHFISDYLGSLKNVCKTFKKSFGINISHQTIENWLFNEETILEFDSGRCSGYYVFDVEWVKPDGEWKYRHTLLDSVSNLIVADAIYDFENEETVKHFLTQATWNKNKIAITTDLDHKYPSIIANLGFKHQYCIWHAKKALNNSLKKLKAKFHLSKEEYEDCKKQLKMVKDLFDLDDYDLAERELQSLIYRKDEFHPVVFEIIRKSVSPRYKSFIYHLKDEKIERTSGKLENAFQKTMPKPRKKTFKTSEGILKRIYFRDLIWNENNALN